MKKLIFLSFLALATRFAAAQVPSAEQIDKDLKGEFAATQAEPVIKTHGELSARIEKLLMQQGRYMVSTLHPWNRDPKAELLTAGGSKEADIRPNSQTLYGLATLCRTVPADHFPADFTKQIAHDKTIAMLRFILPTHFAGGVKLRDGKFWHNQWQSSHWAASAGAAAWLVWDDLDPQMKWLAARMICDEADRYIDLKPPMQIIDDTKAEENIWDSMPITLAYCMFPNHPHHEMWHQAAIRWIINSYPTESDMKRNNIIDGKPLSQWLVGANIHEDYTLENHDRVHPDYMSTGIMAMYQKLDFEWSHLTPFQSLDWNIEKLYNSSKILTFADGGYVYPNGEDWQIHRNADWTDYHFGIAIQFGDPEAARLGRLCLETAEKMAARNRDFPMVLPTETNFASTHAMMFEDYSHTYLLMLSKGEGPEPVSEESIWAKLVGFHPFDAGKFALERTDKSISTFSWSRQIMGMVLPMQRDLLFTPNERSMVGMIDNDAPVIREVKRLDIPKTLAVCGVIDRGALEPEDAPPLRAGKKKGAESTPPAPPKPPITPKLEQRFGYVALPDGRTVYVDTLKQTNDVRPKSVELGTLSVLNDINWVYHNGERTLHYDGGQTVFKAKEAESQPTLKVHSSWFNLDDCLGIGLLGTSGEQEYVAHPSGAKGRLEQLFHLNVVPKDKLEQAAAGSNITRDAFVFFPAQKASDTAAAVGKCSVSGDETHPAVTLDDGTKIVFNLDDLSISIQEH